MPIIYQISPVGFEYDRSLAGIGGHPCNHVILLQSALHQGYQNDYDIKNMNRSRVFTNKLEDTLEKDGTREVHVRRINFTRLDTMVEDLCRVIEEIMKWEQVGRIADEIWINTSTGNKAFTFAAMYVASFNVEKIRLFYTSAKHYTITKIADNDTTKEEILDIYRDHGVTFEDGHADDFTIFDVPVIPAEKISHNQALILEALLPENREFGVVPASKTYDGLFEHMGIDIDALEPAEIKSLKMKLRHHIVRLETRKLIEVMVHGRQRKFKLTERGVIIAIIVKYLGDMSDAIQKED